MAAPGTLGPAGGRTPKWGAPVMATLVLAWAWTGRPRSMATLVASSKSSMT